MTDTIIPASHLLVLTEDTALSSRLAEWLGRFGWQCEIGVPSELADRVSTQPYPAVVLADTRHHDPAVTIQAIRQAPAPFNGTPVIVLDLPLAPDAFLEALRQRSGPIDAHALRADPHDPRYRLIRLLGFDQAEAMIARFRAALCEAVDEIDRNGPPSPETAHRLAGMAGLVGFTEVGALWSRVEQGEAGALAEAILASRTI